MLATLNSLIARYECYITADVSRVIFEDDDMFFGNLDDYLRTGRAAVDIIFRALLISGNVTPTSILDLPCGAGRVTRHLRAAFPDSELFVSELVKERQEFAARQFGATPIDVDVDFSGSASRQFDLIFVGSLLTHLDETHFRAALSYFIEALARNGVLIVTLHGRRNLHCSRSEVPVSDEEWRDIVAQCLEEGFRFTETTKTPIPYGCLRTSPAWVMRAVETDNRVRVIGFEEGGWEDNQDVLILKRHSIDAARGVEQQEACHAVGVMSD